MSVNQVQSAIMDKKNLMENARLFAQQDLTIKMELASLVDAPVDILIMDSEDVFVIVPKQNLANHQLSS